MQGLSLLYKVFNANESSSPIRALSPKKFISSYYISNVKAQVLVCVWLWLGDTLCMLISILESERENDSFFLLFCSGKEDISF